MDYNNNNIIIARATPIGKSALAVIRVTGQKLEGLIFSIFNCNSFIPNFMQLKKVKIKNTNIVVDSCMVVFYKSPKSFTGEDMLEISCHGNDRIVNKIIEQFLNKSVRIAYPGEFSFRAFKNGKIDLMQAESIASKINQNSDQYGVALQNLEKGATSKKINQLRKSILTIQSVIEHELDFSEEEISHMSIVDVIKKFKEIILDIENILNWSMSLQKIEQGYKVVLLGTPNAGKSTLFNKIIGTDKAIVTEIKGTTRDVNEANIHISGVPFSLFDTAGYRNTDDKIESLGIQKTISMSQNADFILVLDDNDPIAQHKILIDENPFLKNKQTIYIKTKCDNGVNNDKNKVIETSCNKNLGLDSLLTVLLTITNLDLDKNDASNIALCNIRQINLLKQIKLVFEDAMNSLENNIEMDIVASQLKGATDMFDELLGKMTSNEILNNIFKGFCVGK